MRPNHVFLVSVMLLTAVVAISTSEALAVGTAGAKPMVNKGINCHDYENVHNDTTYDHGTKCTAMVGTGGVCLGYDDHWVSHYNDPNRKPYTVHEQGCSGLVQSEG